jgi:3-hydroxyisobutyrate dehydrogenase
MKVGFLGTGLMGAPMVERLAAVGISVIAYNRSVEKLEPLRAAGVTIARSADEAIESADCLILMLTNAAAIEEVLSLATDDRTLEKRTVIQMGTIAPSRSRAIGDRVEAKGGEYIEAPVLGSIPEAKAGTLLVMVGSTEAQFQRWSGLLSHLGSEPTRIGEVGAASAVKLALNQLIASLTSAFALSVAFLERQEVDIEKFMTILRQSALYAPTFDKKLQRMLDRNYTNPNFPTKHLLKDVNLFLSEAGEENLALFPLEGVRQILDRAIDLGLSEGDYSALYSAFIE